MLQEGKKCHIEPSMLRGVCIAMLGLSSSDDSSDYSLQSPERFRGQTEITSFLGGSINHNRTSSEASSIHTRAVQYPQQKLAAPIKSQPYEDEFAVDTSNECHIFGAKRDWGINEEEDYGDDDEWDDVLGSLGHRSSIGAVDSSSIFSHSRTRQTHAS